MAVRSDVEKTILDVIRRQSGGRMEVLPGTPLGDGGLAFDSMGMLQLVLNIEKAVGLRLRNEDLTEDALSTAGQLVDHVVRLCERDGRIAPL